MQPCDRRSCDVSTLNSCSFRGNRGFRPRSCSLPDAGASVNRAAAGWLTLIAMWVGEKLAKCRDKIREVASPRKPSIDAAQPATAGRSIIPQQAAVPNCRSKIKVPESHENETNLGHTTRPSEYLTRRVHSAAAKTPLRAFGRRHRCQLTTSRTDSDWTNRCEFAVLPILRGVTHLCELRHRFLRGRTDRGPPDLCA